MSDIPLTSACRAPGVVGLFRTLMVVLCDDLLAGHNAEMYASPAEVDDRVLDKAVQMSTCKKRDKLEKGVAYIVMGATPATIDAGRVMARVRGDSCDW